MVLENVTIVYGGRRVLEASTLPIEPGRVTALLGRNGTGKSSIFRSIYGLYTDREMSVSVDGRRMAKPHTVPGLINYIPQDAAHPPRLTVSALLTHYGLRAGAFYERYPLFPELDGTQLRDLSHGTERLLVTLVALEADTRYTILDEPFSNVMPLHNDMLTDTIRRVTTRKGVLLSDHQYRTVLAVADELYLIADRRIRKLTAVAELVDFGYLREDPD